MTEAHPLRGEFLTAASGRIKERFVSGRSVLSMFEYLELVMEDPRTHLRNAAQFLADMLTHFGTSEREFPAGKARRFKVFDGRGGNHSVVGQEATQSAFAAILNRFTQSGRIDRLVLIHGPNGSAKSSFVNALVRGAEEYSEKPEGALYRFSWVFPNERVTKGGKGIGFRDGGPGELPMSYASLPPDEIDARLLDEFSDHPILLLPHPERALFFASVRDKLPKGYVIPKYLETGDLSPKNQKIFSSLLMAYRGDYEAVLRHVQVERFSVSRRYRVATASIEPQMNVDAVVRQITADKSLGSLPAALQNTTLYSAVGPVIDANRGILEFNDLLKRPIESFKYLLVTSETSLLNVETLILFLDTVLIATANEKHLDAFKDYADFPSFKGRMELIRMPYLLRYSDEARVYAGILDTRDTRHVIAPHALEVAALWAVMTRLNRPVPDGVTKEAAALLRELKPLPKALLYDSGVTPPDLTPQQTKELRACIPALMEQGAAAGNYEGGHGASPREMSALIAAAGQDPAYPGIHPLGIFKKLRQLVADPSVYEYLRMKPDGYYYQPAKYVNDVEEWYLDIIDREFSQAMGLAHGERYIELFTQYVTQVSHWVKGEKIQDRITGEYREADEAMMKELEKIIMPGDVTAKVFRNDIIGQIGAAALEHPGHRPDFARIFPAHISKLMAHHFEQREAEIKKIGAALRDYLAGETVADAAMRARAETVAKRLETEFGYTREHAAVTLAYLLKSRY